MDTHSTRNTQTSPESNNAQDSGVKVYNFTKQKNNFIFVMFMLLYVAYLLVPHFRANVHSGTFLPLAMIMMLPWTAFRLISWFIVRIGLENSAVPKSEHNKLAQLAKILNEDDSKEAIHQIGVYTAQVILVIGTILVIFS